MHRQLWAEATPALAIPKARLRGRLLTTPLPRLRSVSWPDGTPCWQVNSYLLSRCKKGLLPSSANSYASELCHFVRFVALAKKSFTSLIDDDMFLYADYLAASGKLLRARPSGSHINRLVGRAIRLLIWLQTVIPGKRLVGLEGDQANVTIDVRDKPLQLPGRARRIESRFTHACFVARTESIKVRPMSERLLEKMLEAADSDGQRFFGRARNTAIINLLAASGVRREELTFMTKADLLGAIENDGMLNCRTSKRHGNPVRQVPVPVEVLREIKENYVDTAREMRLEKLGVRRDEGWLFCTQTGRRMRPSTVTHLFSRLKRSAGITEKAAPHMLRHRWITRQLVARLRELGALSPLSAGLMVTLMSRLASATGHSRLESMLTYVDQGFEQIVAELRHGREQQILDAQKALGSIRELLRTILDNADADELLEVVSAGLRSEGSIPRLDLSVHIEHGISLHRVN